MGSTATATPHRIAAISALALALLVASILAPRAYASAGFGIESYGLSATEEGGSTDEQAGSHPYALTAEATLDQGAGQSAVRSLHFELPPGLTLDPNVAARCALADFYTNACPAGSMVGTVQMSIAGTIASAAVYNLAPALGQFGLLGVTVDGLPLSITVAVRTGGDYGLTLKMDNIPVEEIESVKLTLGESLSPGLITLPTTCASALTTMLRAESWGAQAASSPVVLSALTGCDRLPFAPSLDVQPDSALADAPSGYQLSLHMPQPKGPVGLAFSQLENASVTLPEGVSLSLAGANGLTGCEEAQFALDSGEPPRCATSSKVGEVQIDTPLLSHPLEGGVFFATPGANPFGALATLYVLAEERSSGIVVKLAGELTLNADTGQPILTLEGLPRLPIEDIELHLFGGERALLANPARCGEMTSVGKLTPWSGDAAVNVSSSFEVGWLDSAQTCPDPLPFEPSLNAGTGEAPAGSYSSLVLAVSHEYPQQSISRLNFQLPSGLEWAFSNVSLCGEPAAGEGTCPQASQIGTAITRFGPGRLLAWFTGPVYLTERYAGGQYGLSIALSAGFGPFELGKLVVRAAVSQSQGTGALTIAAYMPQIIDGIPLQTNAFEIEVDHPDLVLNPTVCASRQIGATIEGSQGTIVQTSSPFVTPGCQAPPTGHGSGSAGSGAAPLPKIVKPMFFSHVTERIEPGDRLRLAFTTLADGTVTITGQGIRRYVKKMHTGTHRVEIALSGHGVFDIRHHRRFALRLMLATASGLVSTRTVAVAPRSGGLSRP